MIDCRKDKKRRTIRGSLTVEAALTLPIFIFAVTAFLYLFQFIYIQQGIQTALNQTASFFSKNAYIYGRMYDAYSDETQDIEELAQTLGIDEYVSSVVYKLKFKQYIKDGILDSPMIIGGSSGVSIQPQSDYFEDDEVDLCAYYTVRIPVLFFKIDSFECVQRIKTKNWTGVEAVSRYGETEKEDEETTESEEETEIVYVTVNGKRYHTHRDCTHLKLSVQQTTYGEVGYQRNKSGGTYRACELCANRTQFTEQSIVYITDEGDCYHASAQCGGLSRYIREVAKSEVEGQMACCKRCQKRDQATSSEGE